ncbi:MAG: 4-hydroxy-tetrahydrodipicolinate reductase [Luteibaculum sp.]
MAKEIRVAIIGYGKMGRAISEQVDKAGHKMVAAFSSGNPVSAEKLLEAKADVAIEFTRPEAAVDNIMACIKAKVPVVVGTTGWYKEFKSVKKAVKAEKATLLYATNFSVGVNLMFELNRKLAKLMNKFPEYGVSMSEIHHTQKLDAPSGTAITLAEDIISQLDGIERWNLTAESVNSPKSVPITAIREEDVKGTHIVQYTSAIDKIELKHEAFSREGFAKGSLLAAEFLVKQEPGVYTMRDFFKSL